MLVSIAFMKLVARKTATHAMQGVLTYPGLELIPSLCRLGRLNNGFDRQPDSRQLGQRRRLIRFEHAANDGGDKMCCHAWVLPYYCTSGFYALPFRKINPDHKYEFDVASTESRTTCMIGNNPRGSCEMPGTSSFSELYRSEKVRCRNANMHVSGKSGCTEEVGKQCWKANGSGVPEGRRRDGVDPANKRASPCFFVL